MAVEWTSFGARWPEERASILVAYITRVEGEGAEQDQSVTVGSFRPNPIAGVPMVRLADDLDAYLSIPDDSENRTVLNIATHWAPMPDPPA